MAVGNIFERIALALRLGDFNFLISNQITSQEPRALRARRACRWPRRRRRFSPLTPSPTPSSPTARSQYVLDGYTTTSQYPYSENASNLNVNMGGLPSSFNYARNAVKVVVNAYTGADEVLRERPERPHPQGLPLGLPERCSCP